MSSRPSTNSRWSTPSRMCWTPSWRYPSARSLALVTPAERHRRVGRPQQVALQPPVGVLEAHQDVGDRGLEPRDRDRLSCEPARAPERPAHDHRARRELLLVGRRQAGSPPGAPGRSGSRPRRRWASSKAASTSRGPVSRSSRKPGRASCAPAGLRAPRASPMAIRQRPPPHCLASFGISIDTVYFWSRRS